MMEFGTMLQFFVYLKLDWVLCHVLSEQNAFGVFNDVCSCPRVS